MKLSKFIISLSDPLERRWKCDYNFTISDWEETRSLTLPFFKFTIFVEVSGCSEN